MAEGGCAHIESHRKIIGLVGFEMSVYDIHHAVDRVGKKAVLRFEGRYGKMKSNKIWIEDVKQ